MNAFPDSKVYGANMGPGGPHVGPMNLDIWVGWGKTFSRMHTSPISATIPQGYPACGEKMLLHLS